MGRNRIGETIMPTPAEILLENSTLQSGTPWEHLNAQEGGEGTGPILIVGEVEIDTIQDVVDIDIIDTVSIEVDLPDRVEVNVIDTISIKTETDIITVETCK